MLVHVSILTTIIRELAFVLCYSYNHYNNQLKYVVMKPVRSCGCTFVNWKVLTKVHHYRLNKYADWI